MKRLAVTIGVATFLLLSATPLFSQDAIDETTLEIGIPDEGTGGDESLSVFKAWDFIKMLLILGAVIAVIYGLFHFLKKSGNPKFNETRLIRVLSSKTLTGARALHLVEVGNQIFLVGTSENAVNLVSEIADKETLDSLKLQAANAQAVEKRSFASILGQTFGRPAASKPNTAADPMAFLRQQRQRIRNM
ncbi:MAG: flagellar biosynthetic protein FliO [Spirochaetales bacterium]|nr:flagellar biosynthetic protein FliO [Spirochaetales bacterium]